jgi:hypothetical protein
MRPLFLAAANVRADLPENQTVFLEKNLAQRNHTTFGCHK